MIFLILLLAQLGGETQEPQYSINVQPGQCVRANADYTFTIITCPPADIATLVKRDPHQVVLFREANTCPSTNKKGNHPCPGWIVNHVVPLCYGGIDNPSNMEWEQQAPSYKRDVFERAVCKGK